jgi:hypothetical protein
MKRIIIRGKTNDGDAVKQYCFVAENKDKGYVKSVIIHRLILTDQKEDYLLTGHNFVRQYRGKYVFSKSYSLKLETLNKIVEWANKIEK